VVEPMDRPIDPTPDPWEDEPMDTEWGAELFESGGPEEPTAAERERHPAYVDAREAFSSETQEALTLLAFAVDRLGGSLVITREEVVAGRFKLGFDTEFGHRTGGIRVYVIQDPREDA
jgi:hypothetical protein